MSSDVSVLAGWSVPAVRGVGWDARASARACTGRWHGCGAVRVCARGALHRSKRVRLRLRSPALQWVPTTRSSGVRACARERGAPYRDCPASAWPPRAATVAMGRADAPRCRPRSVGFAAAPPVVVLRLEACEAVAVARAVGAGLVGGSRRTPGCARVERSERAHHRVAAVLTRSTRPADLVATARRPPRRPAARAPRVC